MRTARSIHRFAFSYFARFTTRGRMVTHSMDNILNMQYYPTNNHVEASPPPRKRRCLNKEVNILSLSNVSFFSPREISAADSWKSSRPDSAGSRRSVIPERTGFHAFCWIYKSFLQLRVHLSGNFGPAAFELRWKLEDLIIREKLRMTIFRILVSEFSTLQIDDWEPVHDLIINRLYLDDIF